MASVAVAAAGLAGGAILGSTLSAGAATTAAAPTAATPAAVTTPSTAAPSTDTETPEGNETHTYGHTLGKTGTVTAVSASSISIKDAPGTNTTYVIATTSDIDKNGVSTASALTVGETVTYSVDSAATTPTIDKLRAGSEALDRPTGDRYGAPSDAAPSTAAPSTAAPSTVAPSTTAPAG